MAKEVIRIEGLGLGYGEKKILENVNATIHEGELVGIIGCNGAGKSTFLKTIRGMLPKQGGQVLFFEKPMESYSDKELAKKVAYLQQSVELGFGYTGLDIVLAGRYPYKEWWQSENDSDKELALKCMEYTGTADLAERPITAVSGGQKQRILLAKVLAQQTPVLFLDEPTTGLDMVYKEEIFRFAKALAEKNKTVLMVVHELDLAAKYCSRILLLGQGGLLADGEPKQVFNEELLSKAYKADIQVTENPENGNLEITTRESTNSNGKRLLEEICGR